jgi:hypothetical protein
MVNLSNLYLKLLMEEWHNFSKCRLPRRVRLELSWTSTGMKLLQTHLMTKQQPKELGTSTLAGKLYQYALSEP